ncbi:MAG TPA: Fic family protein [Pirellulales bacterium]|nr:Fic family protein [Pirellulales bacterium]
MTTFLSTDDVLEIHRRVIEVTGGAAGLRDVGLLDSAVHRPRATFGGVFLYPTLAKQGAALLHSLAKSHAFVDAPLPLAQGANSPLSQRPPGCTLTYQD